METYDYIVVGAGSAGAAVANRLSADPRNKVLLLEAGRASHPWSPIPIGMARLIANPAANWLYSSEPEANTNGRRIPVPRTNTMPLIELEPPSSLPRGTGSLRPLEFSSGSEE